MTSWFVWLITVNALAAAEHTISRCGNELIIQVKSLDLLRQNHQRLDATLRLTGDRGERVFHLNMADRLVPDSLVVDLSGYSTCHSASIEIRDRAGKIVHTQSASPIPTVTLSGGMQRPNGTPAAIERGSQFDSTSPPVIVLPDVAGLRSVPLTSSPRQVSTNEITYPVVAEIDLPALSSANAVIVSRQSFAPGDPSRCSLYFSYRKALIDNTTAQLKEYRKMLVEVPLDRQWLAESGDATVTLPLQGFAIHTTDDLEVDGKRWNAPRGYNMLGGSSTGLFQGGSTVDTDDQGRIYISNVADGAGIVRFNPQLGRFEQPPVNFYAECNKFLPTTGPWRRSWDADLAQVVCTRGRIYIVFDRHYRVTTPNGKFETCSGVVSIPQDNWHDADAFRRDIRFHAGCWPDVKPSLYQDELIAGQTRRAGAPVPTTHGIAFGTWRLDLDQHGNLSRLVTVRNLSDTIAVDGTTVPPTDVVKIHGLPKSRLQNVGAAGRPFLTFRYGEFEISRAALGLTLPGASAEHLVGKDGRFQSTYPGAPAGVITVRFDITSKIKREPQRYQTLARALTGVSQGPNYAVISIPGEADQAIGICEYSYYFSKLDFSKRATERKVFRSYLPLSSQGQPTELPINVGFGPYNTAWFEHDQSLWLYTMGYTGLGRLKYAEHGKPLTAFQQEVFHQRLSPKAIDGKQRDSVKDFLHLVPAVDGRLINIGRGRPGRGGGAYSAGLELFHPSTLGASQTAVSMNRCYGLFTPVSRLILSAAQSGLKQQVFAASGEIRPEYIEDLAEISLRPANQDPKIFLYEISEGGTLADRFGFSLPRLPGTDSSSNVVFSPCRQFLVILQAGGVVHTYSVAQRRFVDSVRLEAAAAQPIQLLSYSRPTGSIWTAPNGQIFFLAALEGNRSTSVSFFEVQVGLDGRMMIAPHLTIVRGNQGSLRDFDGVVRGFLPDLVRRDGSYDLILGGSTENGGQPTVRVIDDFVSARN